MRRWLYDGWGAAGVSAIVSLLVLGGCARDQSAVGSRGSRHPWTLAHTLRIGGLEEVSSLNPHLDFSVAVGDLSALTMAYLVRYDGNDRPTPELATVIPSQRNGLISADGRAITWRLRHGVRWSDGAMFTADDVVFSTNAVKNTANNEVGRAGWDLIQKIDEPDKYTVVYHLAKPYGSFIPTFFSSAGANPCILPRHLLGSLHDINHALYNSLPVGIGPFRYTGWVRGDRVSLEANPYYWRGKPKLAHIVYKFIPDRNTMLTQLQTGEIDVWPYVGTGYYERVKAVRSVSVIARSGYRYNHIDFNETRPLFREQAVRAALRYALDRQTLRAKLAHGLGVLSDAEITPASPLGTMIAPTAFDIGKANSLLTAAGWGRGANGVREKNGRRLAFDFALSSGLADADSAVEVIRSDWERVGAEINVRHYASRVMFAPYSEHGIIETSAFDAIFFSWQMTPDGDIAVTHACDQAPPAGENDEHYCNAQVDGLLREAAASYDPVMKRRLLGDAQRLIARDVPEIVTSILPDIYAFNSDLRGWRPNGITPFDSMMNVDI